MSDKLTKSAQGETCTVRLPFVCNHNPETVVLAHLNGIRFGHGTGRKIANIFGAYACSKCHDVIDGRVPYDHLTHEEVKLSHFQGVIETQMKMIDKGLIKF